MGLLVGVPLSAQILDDLYIEIGTGIFESG